MRKNKVAKLLETYFGIEDKYLSYLKIDRNMYLFDNDHRVSKLITFDVETHNEREENFKIPCLGHGTCIVSLPNCKIFCYGGSTSRVNNWTCIIDRKRFLITQLLTPGARSKFAAGIYFEGLVYIFGGDDTSHRAEKFDILQNRWFRLASVPAYCRDCSCALFKNSIYLALNRESKIYQYDISLDSYADIEVPNKPFAISCSEQRGYIFEHYGGSICESEIDNMHAWTPIGVFSAVFHDQVFTRYWENAVYIGLYAYESDKITMDFYVYKFDLKRKGEAYKIANLNGISML
ncbi:unnamed protein product [Blepharisma stoltei]|uniref:Uncharacterized protein n=1 Tax=Blepharisma stoltei TaxID=1481888 RepID=A0AAU9IF82_9CILI|nr:unnamed protein product [Blepharisma stoltei]